MVVTRSRCRDQRRKRTRAVFAARVLCKVVWNYTDGLTLLPGGNMGVK